MDELAHKVPGEQFEEAMERGGVHGALEFLNARSPYRYTAIYRFEGEMVRNLYFFDRLGTASSDPSPVPMGDTFCQFVGAPGTFSTGNSLEDSRLDEHPKREELKSYFGLPLSRNPGTLFGSLCHFDVLPQSIADDEIPFLESIAPELMKHLKSSDARLNAIKVIAACAGIYWARGLFHP